MGEATAEEVLTAMVEEAVAPNPEGESVNFGVDEDTGEECYLGYDGCDDSSYDQYESVADRFPKDVS